VKFILLVLVVCGVIWGVWGLVPALLAFGFLATWYAFALYNGPRMAARNAVYAALTCRKLDFGQLGAIDAGVEQICRRMGIDPTRLGPAFPMSEALPTDLERRLFNHPADVFSLRALAMHECGIPPIGTKVPRWFVVRNPFWASTAPRSLQRYRKQVLQQHGVDLVELDLESYVDLSRS
jgi:hypothetical protein